MTHLEPEMMLICHAIAFAAKQGGRAQSIELANGLFVDLPTSYESFANDRSRSYSRSMLSRYIEHSGMPPRSHKGNANWSLFDKMSYIFTQIKTRSEKAKWYAPIQNRFLVKFDQLSDCHREATTDDTL